MNTTQFLQYLDWLGVELYADNDRLRYSAPKGAISPKLLKELSSRKWELLSTLKNVGWASTPARPIERVARSGKLPLSYSQKRVWFFDQLVPGSPSYNIAGAVNVTGPLDVAVLEKTLNEIVRRHETLRTTFVAVDAQPYQVITPDLSLHLRRHDLTRLPRGEQRREADRLAAAQARAPFDLEQGPLVRAGLVVLGEQEHVLLVTLHHIISDGWSMGVLIREVAALYEAFSKGGPARTLPEPGIQFADYAVWQMQQLEAGLLDRQLPYWKQQLAEVPAMLELPTDHPRPTAKKFLGASLPVVLSESLTASLKELGKRESATLYMILLAGFNAMLSRYSRQEDIVVGTPIANRNLLAVEGLIGYFANTLPMRTNLSGDPSVSELIRRVREVALGAFAHQDVPFEKLVSELQPERQLSQTPLFQVMLVMQNGPAPVMEFCGLRLTPAQLDTGTSKCDLTLCLQASGNKIDGTLEYDSEIFDGVTIRRMIQHFENILAEMAASPDKRLSEIDVLSDAERRLVVETCNDTGKIFDGALTLAEMFERQVEKTPGALAVAFEHHRLTYRELNAQANHLARGLRVLGVRPESLVGVYLERGQQTAVAVLAVLKAGGAYVPLDPAYPRQRVMETINNAGIKVLVTQQSLAEQLPPHAAEVVCMDELADAASLETSDNLKSGVLPDNLAYVIYTSGSTGEPKGIALPHRALVNLIEWHLSHLLNGVRTLQFASLSFDASFHEMFAAWSSGGSLFVASNEDRIDSTELARLISREGIEKVILPVVVLQQLAEHACFQPGACSTLKEVMATGEQLQITVPIITFFKSVKGCALHNHYGPSETHVVTAHLMEDNPDSWPSRPAIGRPIANTQLYILDQNLSPVPVGIPGEVYIGGVALARGYLGQPGLTAERFVPDTFANPSGARLYKTGDLARRLPGGEIEFIARLDSQVKIRGFRVEPGEIEAVLGRHPQVREAAVMVREDVPGNKELVGYVVAGQHCAPAVTDLRCFLREQLAEYMIPSAFVLLEALPLTINGKVDRRALPPPNRLRPEMEAAFVAPRTPVETVVAQVWSQVIGVEKVGLFDNFFTLGGHSLLASQAILRLREIFHVELALASLFEAPTVDGLVKLLARLWEGREIVEEIAWTFLQIETLSDEDVQVMLANQRQQAAQNRGQMTV